MSKILFNISNKFKHERKENINLKLFSSFFTDSLKDFHLLEFSKYFTNENEVRELGK